MISLKLAQLSPQESYQLPYPIRPFSVAEYELLARHQILTEDDKVELLEGFIVPKKSKTPFHASVLCALSHEFYLRLPESSHFRNQCVLVTADSAPEPDLTIARGGHEDYSHRHASSEDVSLVIEISDTSLARDRTKCRIYARANINTYWIVNLPELCAEVFTLPVADEYTTAWKFSIGESLAVPLPDGTSLSLPFRNSYLLFDGLSRCRRSIPNGDLAIAGTTQLVLRL